MSVRAEIIERLDVEVPKPWYITVKPANMHGIEAEQVVMSWNNGKYIEVMFADNLKLRDSEKADLFISKLKSYLGGRADAAHSG